MSMLKAPKSAAPRTHREELREDQLATATVRARNFVEDYQRPLIIAAIGVVVLLVAVIGWRYWRSVQDRHAAEALGGVLTAYEAGEYQQALEGSEGRPGLIAIADQYGATETGNLATFFAGDALYQLGQYEEAARYFERYSAGNDLLGASALAARAGLAEMRGAWADAAGLYLRAADAVASAATTPDYLMAAGRNFEAAGDHAEAQGAYERYLDAWGETPNAGLVEALLARARAAQAG